MESLILLGYYVSSLGFLIATIMIAQVARRFGASALGSIFTYVTIGTGVFFAVTVFQKLGADFFSIADDSVDIWWHLLFYLAVGSYFLAFRALVGLGATEQGGAIGKERTWGICALAVVAIVFLIPNMSEPIVNAYVASPLAQLGLHHFLAFMLAGFTGSYLLVAKKDLGQIGRAVADPMVIALWALGVQHFWELLFESWKVVDVTSDTGEGVEKIFLTIAAVAVIMAAMRLKAGQAPQAQMAVPA